MSGIDMAHESFKESHGKIVNGRSYTYKELESSLLEKIKNFGCTVILIGLFIFCLLCIYEVDIKKGSHDDVLAKIENLSNYTVSDIVNGTVQATNELGNFVQDSFKVGSAKGIQLKQWVSNKSQELLTQIAEKAQKKQEIFDVILNAPRLVLNYISDFYTNTIKGETSDEAVQEIEVEIEQLDKEEIIEIEEVTVEVDGIEKKQH